MTDWPQKIFICTDDFKTHMTCVRIAYSARLGPPEYIEYTRAERECVWRESVGAPFWYEIECCDYNEELWQRFGNYCPRCGGKVKVK
jgi:hypothetical protein